MCESFHLSCKQDIECRNLNFLEGKRNLRKELEKQKTDKEGLIACKEESDGSLVMYLLT